MTNEIGHTQVLISRHFLFFTRTLCSINSYMICTPTISWIWTYWSAALNGVLSIHLFQVTHEWCPIHSSIYVTHEWGPIGELCSSISLNTHRATSQSALLQSVSCCLALRYVHTYRGTCWSAALQLDPTLLKEIKTTWSAGLTGALRSSWSTQQQNNLS